MHSYIKRNNLLSVGLRKVRRSISRQFVKVSIIDGRERHTQQPISVLFSGSKLNKSYFEKLIFGESCTESKYIKVWKNKSMQYISDANRHHDLAIIMSDEIPGIKFHETDIFMLPNWVGGEWNLLNQAKTRRHREKLNDDKRRVRKQNYKYRVTRKPEEFERFYNTMHKPYIKRVFNDHAFLMTSEEMNETLAKCELFYVTKNDQDIAGGILVYDENKRVRGWSLGVKDGETQWVKDGAIVALLHLQKKYLLEKGYSNFHLGAVRPFLKDGALTFKKNRGLSIVDHTANGFLLIPLRDCVGVRGFLQNNPFIYLEKSSLKGAVFISEDNKITTKELEQIYHNLYLPGLECLDLYKLATEHSNKQVIRGCGYIDKLGELHTFL